MVYNIGFFLLAGIAIFVGGWYSKEYFSKQATPPQPTPTPIRFPTVIPSPTPPQTTDEESIKQAMAQKHSKAVSAVVIRISQNTGTHAQGSVTFAGEMGGGWFLAYKSAAGWMIVDDGNGTISCETIAPYTFPVAMVTECVNASGALIRR